MGAGAEGDISHGDGGMGAGGGADVADDPAERGTGGHQGPGGTRPVDHIEPEET